MGTRGRAWRRLLPSRLQLLRAREAVDSFLNAARFSRLELARYLLATAVVAGVAGVLLGELLLRGRP